MNESETSREHYHRSPEQLAAALGFIETPELLDLRTAIVLEYAIDNERAIELKIRYEELAEEEINRLRLNPDQLADVQIGLILMCASMKLHAGQIDGYDSELDQAQAYAYLRKDDQLVGQIDDIRLQ